MAAMSCTASARLLLRSGSRLLSQKPFFSNSDVLARTFCAGRIICSTSAAAIPAVTGIRGPYEGASAITGEADNLVNVSKVLVVGSGALSIGQAGEFDYSG